MNDDPDFRICFGPLYREEDGVLRFWELIGWSEGDGFYEVERCEGPVGGKEEQLTQESLPEMSREEFLAFGEKEANKKKAEGFEEREPHERLVVQLNVYGLSREKAEETRDYIEGILWGWLSESGNGRTASLDMGDGLAYIFFDVIDADTAIRMMDETMRREDWVPLQHYRIGRLRGSVYFDVTPEVGRGRLPWLSSNGLRRFSLSSVEGAFETGRTKEGKQVLLGLRPPYLAAFLFGEGGAFVEVIKRAWETPPPRRHLWYDLDDEQFRRALSLQLAAWKEELGFTSSPIAVQGFFNIYLGVGIDEFPLVFDPDEDEETQANAWLSSERFVFWWGDAYVPAEAGALIRQSAPGPQGDIPGTVRFTGPSLPLESKGAPEKITIPYEDDDHSRFNCVGRWGGSRLFMAFVTGADPIHAEWGRPMYPDLNDPSWPTRKRWYGVVHLFDEDGTHLQTMTLLGGTTAQGKGAACDRARALTNAALRGLGPLDFGTIEVRPFAVESDGYLFGLVYEPQEEGDKGGEYVMLWPNDVMFHPPWDGDYST